MRQVPATVKSTVSLIPNPSHLEFANPVLQGVARARQTFSPANGERDEASVVPICIHGDAAFPGRRRCRRDVQHVAAARVSGGRNASHHRNNQVGFTTDPIDARSTHYASDLAKGFEVPIVHVNADDANTCMRVMQLGDRVPREVREGFPRSISSAIAVTDTTRPTSLRSRSRRCTTQIRSHPSPREVWGQRLVDEGLLTADEVKQLDAELAANFERIQSGDVGERWRDAEYSPAKEAEADQIRRRERATPRADADRLVALNEQLLVWPQTLKPNSTPREDPGRRARRDGRRRWNRLGPCRGAGVRVAAHRRQVGPAHRTGRRARHVLAPAGGAARRGDGGDVHAARSICRRRAGKFEIYNSPLSETAVLGFEYGFSTATRECAGVVGSAVRRFRERRAADHRSVHRGRSREVGAGFVDRAASSSRIRRAGTGALERAARAISAARAPKDNMRVAYPSTPAQYFHVLRRQSSDVRAAPADSDAAEEPAASSRSCVADYRDLTERRFPPGDRRSALHRRAATQIKRLVFCTGKIYYDLAARRAPHVAIVRVEELYPWPGTEIAQIVDLYPAIEEVVWAQEEPKNMGAWSYVAPRLRMSTGNALITALRRPPGAREPGRRLRRGTQEGAGAHHR